VLAITVTKFRDCLIIIIIILSMQVHSVNLSKQTLEAGPCVIDHVMWRCRAGLSQARGRVRRDGSRDSAAMGGWTSSHPLQRSLTVRRQSRIIDDYNLTSYLYVTTSSQSHSLIVVYTVAHKNNHWLFVISLSNLHQS